MTPPTPNSSTVEPGLRTGDTRAFDRLYADLGPRVLGYVLRLTGRNRAEAEDLVQETFLAAYAGHRSYTGRSQPLAWLLGIARRRWRDGRRTVRPEHGATDLSLLSETLPTTEDALPERIARTAALQEALAQLDAPMREALDLVVMQELTYREAAEVTGEPVGTVKWRVHQATRALRRILSEQEEVKHEAIRNESPRSGNSALPRTAGATGTLGDG